MRNFDRAVSELEDIYFYARYVDDIFVFSYKSDFELERITDLLPSGLYANSEKSYVKRVDCRNRRPQNNNPCATTCKCKPDIALNHAVEYLGYQYNFSDVPYSTKGKPREVSVTLSARKIQKIKTRIIKSFLSHIRNPDFELLESRLRFLTGNCEFSVKGDVIVRSGLAYNFPLLKENDESLKELTVFQRKIIHCKNGAMGTKLASVLSASQRKKLGKLSFASGHKNKITYRFSEEKLAKIKKCWAK